MDFKMRVPDGAERKRRAAPVQILPQEIVQTARLPGELVGKILKKKAAVRILDPHFRNSMMGRNKKVGH